MDNTDILKGDNLEIRVSKQKFRSVRNTQNVQILIQYCRITSLSNVNIVKTRLASLHSTQVMHDKSCIFWKKFQGEHLQLIQDKWVSSKIQSYSHWSHHFFQPRISFKQKKKFNCYYFSCSFKHLLGQQSFPPLVEFLSKEKETPRLSPQTISFSSLHTVSTSLETKVLQLMPVVKSLTIMHTNTLT